MLFEKFHLDGRVAIVTCSGRGLRKAMALALAEAGADIAVSARTMEQIQATALEIQQLGRTCLPVQADVGKPDDVRSLVKETLSRFGKIDILVNNAGGGIPQSFVDINDDEWQHALNSGGNGQI